MRIRLHTDLVERVPQSSSDERHCFDEPLWRLHRHIGSVLHGGHRHIDYRPRVLHSTNLPLANEPVPRFHMGLEAKRGSVNVEESERRLTRVAPRRHGSLSHRIGLAWLHGAPPSITEYFQLPLQHAERFFLLWMVMNDRSSAGVCAQSISTYSPPVADEDVVTRA